MTWPANDSPVWPLARQITIAAAFLIGASTMYKNGMSTTDILALAAVLAPVFGLDMMQRASKQKSADSEQVK